MNTPRKFWIVLAGAILIMGVIACSCNSLAQNPTATPLLLQLSPSVNATDPPVATQPPVATDPSAAILPAITDISGILSIEADPIWGPSNLQRGFSPDPRVIGLGSEGIVDTSTTNHACGFTTNAPTFAFTLSGGAEAGFLRIYFTPDDKVDTTLIVHTPAQSWLCWNNSSNGSGDPVIDIDSAALGKYAIWVGVQQNGASVLGQLFITQSVDNTP